MELEVPLVLEQLQELDKEYQEVLLSPLELVRQRELWQE
jgi:hypothetical protein